MSDADQLQSIGKLMIEFRESNQKLVAIEAELHRAQKVFREAGEIFERIGRGYVNPSIHDPSMAKILANLPDPERIRQLVADAITEGANFKRLEPAASEPRSSLRAVARAGVYGSDSACCSALSDLRLRSSPERIDHARPVRNGFTRRPVNVRTAKPM